MGMEVFMPKLKKKLVKRLKKHRKKKYPQDERSVYQQVDGEVIRIPKSPHEIRRI